MKDEIYNLVTEPHSLEMDSKPSAGGLYVKKEDVSIKKEFVEDTVSTDSCEHSENLEKVVKKEFEDEESVRPQNRGIGDVCGRSKSLSQLDRCESRPEFVEIKQEIDDLSEEDIGKHGYITDMNAQNFSFSEATKSE